MYITYQDRQVPKVGNVVDVFLSDGRRKRKTGTIYRVVGGYQYQATKKDVGAVHTTLAEVKQSLEEE